MTVTMPKLLTDISSLYRPENNGKVSKVAEQDFLSGISLGTTQNRNSIDRPSKDSIRTSISQAPLRESFTSRAESTPSKSIPITPRSAAAPRVTNSFQSSSLSEDFNGASHPEEEVGVHEATNLLFGASEEQPPSALPLASTVVSAKSFHTAPRKILRHALEGKRMIYGLSSSTHHHHHAHQQPSKSAVHHSSHHPTHPVHEGGYAAVVISSVLIGDRSGERATSIETGPTATLSVITHNPIMAGLRGDAPSDMSDDDTNELSRAAHARSARHTIRLLNFKNKTTSVSYSGHLKPSSFSSDSNSAARSKMPPPFRFPREVLITSADMILRSVSEETSPSSLETPSKLKHSSKRNLNQVLENSPTRPTPAVSLPSSARSQHRHSDSEDDSDSSSSHNTETEIRLEVTKAIDIFVGESDPSSASSPNTADSKADVSGDASLVAPSNNISANIALDPYERCLIHYDPDFLDHDVETPGKYLFKSRLPGFSSSVITLMSAKGVRNERNEAFRNRHSWLTTDLKLSKVRSVKRKLEHAAIASSLDIACVAFAYVYFEKLILRNFVTNSTAKTLGAACLLLATKFYGLKVLTFQPLVKELSQKMKVAPNMILAHEFYVFRKLKFTLFLEEREVVPHFFKLLNSPLVRDKEFEVVLKERKKAAKSGPPSISSSLVYYQN